MNIYKAQVKKFHNIGHWYQLSYKQHSSLLSNSIALGQVWVLSWGQYNKLFYIHS